jgi:hypothetical protein
MWRSLLDSFSFLGAWGRSEREEKNKGLSLLK